MGILDNGIALVAIIGAVLLAAALLYAWFRNRGTSDRDLARTERATKDLYKAESAAEERRDDTIRPPQ